MRREPRIPGSNIERDVEDEIAFHLESRVSELIARGHAEETARRNAEAELGGPRRPPASTASRLSRR